MLLRGVIPAIIGGAMIFPALFAFASTLAGDGALPSFPAFEKLWDSQAEVAGAVHSAAGRADADLLLDVLTADNQPGLGQLVVFEHDGAGGLEFAFRTPPGESPDSGFHAVAIGDTDDDGQKEILGSATDANRIFLWEAVGDDHFEVRDTGIVQPNAGEMTVRVRVADLDQDGRSEVVFATADLVAGGSHLFVYERSGAAGVNTYALVFDYELPAPSAPLHDFAIGDSDGDGAREIVLSQFSVDATLFRVLEVVGDDTLVEVHAHSSLLAGVLEEPLVGDLNGDGQAEISFSATSGSMAGLAVFDVLGEGNYPLAFSTLSLTGTEAGGISRGKFSCLPFPVLAVTAGTLVQLYAWHPQGYAPLFQSPLQLTSSSAGPLVGGSLELTDLEGDRRPDLIVAQSASVGLYRQSAWCYGCAVNPPESLLILGGEPVLGTTLELGVDDPTGLHAPGSLSFVVVTLAPDPTFPCGTLVPGLAMGAADGLGELLISLVTPNATFAGAPWTGPAEPASVPIPLPDLPALAGVSLYAQGLIFDPSLHGTPHWGLAQAMEIPLS